MKCKYCNCTDEHACEGGCSWFLPYVCSNCLGALIDDVAKRKCTYSSTKYNSSLLVQDFIEALKKEMVA